MKTIYLHIAALLHLTLASAQDYGNSPSSSSLTPTTTTSTASPVGAAAAAVQTVQVGQTGIFFQPDTIKAGTGDVIEFVIHTSHSVARSSFDSPCQPISGTGIWSGFAQGGTIFSVTINDTNPIWLYCAAPEHCQSGMAMVINPPSGSNTLNAYKSAASGVSNSGTPSSIQGGVFGVVSNAQSSASGSASSSASAAATSSASSGNGAGRLAADISLVAGILLGGVALVM